MISSKDSGLRYIVRMTTILHRQSQLSLLRASFSAFPPPLLVLYGQDGTGKSVVLEHIMEEMREEVDFVYVSCVEFDGAPRAMLEYILRQLKKNNNNNDGESFPCTNQNDFLIQLSALLKDSHRNTVLVFGDAERMKRLSTPVMTAILRLQKLTKTRACTVLVSPLPYWDLTHLTALEYPIQIHFPEYNRSELHDILVSKMPPHIEHAECWSQYCRLLLDVLYKTTRSIRQLSFLATEYFHLYVEPIESGDCEANNMRQLYRNFEPFLKAMAHDAYTRLTVDRSHSAGQIVKRLMVTDKESLLELPLHSKYLLLAAFLASNNPPRTDRRYFVKLSNKSKKQAKICKADFVATAQLLSKGPRAFPFERLIAIFYAVCDDDVFSNVDVLCQLTSLVRLGLLVEQPAGDQIALSGQKYKCTISMDFARLVSKNIEFDLNMYLHDPI